MIPMASNKLIALKCRRQSSLKQVQYVWVSSAGHRKCSAAFKPLPSVQWEKIVCLQVRSTIHQFRGQLPYLTSAVKHCQETKNFENSVSYKYFISLSNFFYYVKESLIKFQCLKSSMNKKWKFVTSSKAGIQKEIFFVFGDQKWADFLQKGLCNFSDKFVKVKIAKKTFFSLFHLIHSKLSSLSMTINSNR